MNRLHAVATLRPHSLGRQVISVSLYVITERGSYDLILIQSWWVEAYLENIGDIYSFLLLQGRTRLQQRGYGRER